MIPYTSRVALALITVATLGATPAFAWHATNSHTVNPLTPTSFEVIGRGGISSVDYWCAAGDYARRVLDVPIDQRIYVSRARGRAETENARSAVQFSLDPPASLPQGTPFLLTVTRVGDSLSAWGAWNYCVPQKGRAG
jgi:hypothetical protein